MEPKGVCNCKLGSIELSVHSSNSLSELKVPIQMDTVLVTGYCTFIVEGTVIGCPDGFTPEVRCFNQICHPNPSL